MLTLAKYIFLICLTVFFSNRAGAEAYYCKVTEYGFQRAMGAAQLTLKQMKYWMPEIFNINSQEANFWSGVVYKVVGGNRTSEFQIKNIDTSTGTTYNDTYFLNKTNEFSETWMLTLKSPGYRTIGPVKYTCEATKSASSAQLSGSSNKLKTEFNKLSKCNKKYLQQFLKGQGLYFGGIDGQWGKGTSRAVNAALKLPTFKNMSPNAFFKKIQQNPICN
tara:strand:+ start:377 stop:1033 length:657 start_codon:yes stop_codon:yes gene_type:complete